MTRNNNIFHNLVKNETSITELFCNLMQFKPFRVLFLNIVKEKGAEIDPEKIGCECFETEFGLGKDEKKHGRADLVLTVDENKKYIFEIKIERWCSLTENQPVNYLNYLKKDNKRLLFILPEGYYNIPEICRRWSQHSCYPPENIKQNNIIYWEQIIKRIKDAELDKLNPFIKEFVEIMDKNWFYYEDIVFTQEELNLIELKESEEYNLMTNSNVPKLMNKIFKIIENVKIDRDLSKDLVRQDVDCFGYFVNDKKNHIENKFDVWYGTEFYLWEETGYPIIIEIWPCEDNKDKKKFFNDIKNSKTSNIVFYKHKELGDFCYIPFDLNNYSKDNNANISKKLEEEIKNVIEKLRNI